MAMCQMSNLLENAEMYISSTCSTDVGVIALMNKLVCPVLDSNVVVTFCNTCFRRIMLV